MSANVQWLEELDGRKRNFGTTFGLPWPRGEFDPAHTVFHCSEESKNNIDVPIQSWTTAYWPDGSIKWTGHAIPAITKPAHVYKVLANVQIQNEPQKSLHAERKPELVVTEDVSREFMTVHTGKIEVSFSTTGNSIIRSITSADGKMTGKNGRLILWSQSSLSEDTLQQLQHFEGTIEETKVEHSGPVRTVISIKGRHSIVAKEESHIAWLPFHLRFYLYANSDCIRMMHTIIYDGDTGTDFIRGIGIRFDIPLKDELYNRHVRISGVGRGSLAESVQGITGLRRDPGKHAREAQVQGMKTPSIETWDTAVSSRLRWVPSWNDYSLMQLSPDGFTARKRTKSGFSWVNIPGGTQSAGLVYLGGSTNGGLAVGLRDFWERYPTGLEVCNAASETGEITIWLYSPSAEPMDMRQYHDGLHQNSYKEQLDALNITYEDWEPGTGTPLGIARTNELFIFSLDQSPDQNTFSELSQHVQSPLVLVPGGERVFQTKAFGSIWSPERLINPPCPNRHQTLKNLDFLFKFYKSQVSQRRWYGFWDYGDIMHDYDKDRHTWRYDIGGYAWDNSELSPDLWLWLYFLQTGKADVYRMAEALTRHTGEVDVYHIGIHKGLGTRHGVQHWSDSCKQARISNALYRKYLFYLSGGDERIGDLLEEVLEAEKAILVLDPYRKVRKDKETYVADAAALSISLGTDWGAIASSWLIELERRGPRWHEAEKKLLATINGIGNLTNGFVTGSALYNSRTGEINPPNPDNSGVVQISHLSAMFGLFEVCADIIDLFPPQVTVKFEHAWLEYCRYFNGTGEEQLSRYGVAFGKLQLRQGHSRLTAYAANRLGDRHLAKRAWEQFKLGIDDGREEGYGSKDTWVSEQVRAEYTIAPVDEAVWVSTNITALYGIAAIQNMALIGEYSDE